MGVIKNGTLTTVPGVSVGHYTDKDALTGVTVMTFPVPNVACAEIRGGNAVTRDVSGLIPGMAAETIHAAVFSGGSSYGLATADGVMEELEKAGSGYETPGGYIVPCVPTAILFDLATGDGSVRPGPEEGRQAYHSTSSDPVKMGLVGAGTGATVAKWQGRKYAKPGGVGSAAVSVGNSKVGALAAVNSVGDVFSLEGHSLSGGPPVSPYFPGGEYAEGQNTTLVLIATDAALDRGELNRILVRCHDSMGVCLRPAHTYLDGDTAIAVSCGSNHENPNAIAEAAFEAVGRAIEAAVSE
tara:strand:+ start:577 stop:1470 length:894 start_codon:yes stop_codon:yes gene_type:complete